MSRGLVDYLKNILEYYFNAGLSDRRQPAGIFE
jgi:hypothetical protein